MRIDLLGPLRVVSGDVECTITSRQVRTLLILLALQPQRVISTEWLMGALWEVEGRGVTKNALQAAVTRLRKQLRAMNGNFPLVKTSFGGYLLDVPPLDVDSIQFTTLLDRANSVRINSPTEALRLIRKGLELWRGPALEGVSDLSVLRAEQTKLNEARITALESAAEIRLETGLVREVATDLRMLVEMHPERERLGELLMIALYRSGRQREALDLYHRIRTHLDDDLGIEPGRGLRSVHEAILVQNPVLDGRDALWTLGSSTLALARG